MKMSIPNIPFCFGFSVGGARSCELTNSLCSRGIPPVSAAHCEEGKLLQSAALHTRTAHAHARTEFNSCLASHACKSWQL